MRTENDQISRPLCSVVDDFCLGVSGLDDVGRFETRFAQSLRDSLDEFLSLLAAVLFDLRGVGYQVREQVSGHVTGNRLDDVQYSNFRSGCAELRQNGLLG